MSDPTAASARTLVALYRRRELSPVEVLDATLDRIAQLDGALNAYITVTGELARAGAVAAERAYAHGGEDATAPLLGVPISIKDTIETRGVRTTMGSLLHADRVPARDAIAVERIRAAGAVMLGKTNTSEFGWKAETTNRLVGSTHNPWRIGLTAGGSSGGAAAAVAAGLGPLALGTDAAGSLRIPAAFCGVFGFKPSHGRVPVRRSGALGTLAHHGPIARTVADAALLLDVVAGPDGRDRNCRDDRLAAVAALDGGVRGLRIGWCPSLGYGRVEPAVAACAAAGAARLEQLGAEVVELAPRLEDPHWIVWTLLAAAAAAQHRDELDRAREALDPGRFAFVEHGLGLSAADVAAAAEARDALHARLLELIAPLDLLVTPTVPVAAFPAGQEKPATIAGEPPGDGLAWPSFTYPFNLTGQPAASIPCGQTPDGLPVGLQLVGGMRADGLVLRAAAAFERAYPWPSPPLDAVPITA